MRPRYKTTGCARFFIFFLIFLPIVYFGAAFLRGENGVEELKKMFNKVTGKETTATPEKENSNTTYTIEELEQELEEARKEIRELKETIREKDREIENLKSGE